MQGETEDPSKLKQVHRKVRGRALGTSHEIGLQPGFPPWASRLACLFKIFLW